eukprot:6214_1
MRFPQQKDTAIGRRQMINENPYCSKYRCDPTVLIKTEYVEKPNGQLLFTKLFEPKNKTSVKGMIFKASGFASYIDWIGTDIGVQYAKLGFIVLMFDPIGQGRSDGLYCHINNFEDAIDDAIWIYNYAIDKYIKTNELYTNSIDKNNNYFLMGNSMGGATSILVALKSQKKDNKFKGIIAVAPLVSIHENMKPAAWVNGF